LILHEINGWDSVLTMPCGRDVSLWVGELDVKANSVTKIDIVGLVRIALLDAWQKTLVFEDHIGVHLVQAEVSSVQRFAL